MNVVRDGAKRMPRMIEDILAFSRAGRDATNPSLVDMRVEVGNAMKAWHPHGAMRRCCGR
jgi:hypothetical protein